MTHKAVAPAADWPPEERYTGSPNLWVRLALENGKPAPHAHTCPACYHHIPCQDDCSLLPDLELEDGTPRGHFLCCSPECRDELKQDLTLALAT